MTASPIQPEFLASTNLPLTMTPLVGRVWEVASAGALIRDPSTRLLTLTGPGGVGKTRLALRIAEQTANAFEQGVVFVPLAAVTDPAMVIPAVAERLGVPTQGDQDLRRRLAEFLHAREMLLVLDNFEQVVKAAPEISGLLAAAPSVKILITSRLPLRVSGEQEYPVAPLPLPQTGRHVSAESVLASDAGALFVQRARAVRPDFQMTDDLAVAVAEICRQLDGLPLAIELAASRIRMLPPDALLDRLTDRMRLLSDGPRDAPERLQTMRAAISWSYALLTEQEQQFFRRLAVFAGGFDLEAAIAISEGLDELEVFDLLASLVDKSLIARSLESLGKSRFTMLQTIRDFGLEELRRAGEEPAARRAQTEWLVEIVEEARPFMSTRQNLAYWLNRFEEEHDNIRAVIDWQPHAGAEGKGMQLCGGIFWFWYVRGHFGEGRAKIAQALSQEADGSLSDRARALLGSAMMAHMQGDDAYARPTALRAVELAREADDQWAVSLALGFLGVVNEDLGQLESAIAPLEEALKIAELNSFPATVGMGIVHLGIVAWGQGDSGKAVEYWERALNLQRGIDDQWGAANALSYLGIVACERNELPRATELQREALAYRWEIRNTEDVSNSVANLAMIAVAAGQPERGARLFGAAEATRELIGNPVREPDRSVYQNYIDRARAALGNEAFEQTWATGKLLSLDAAVAEALSPFEATSDGDEQPFDLTARELEVLRLMVDGLSDKEIADQLYISTRTAQGHASHILGKMGVHSRTAATSLAIREGIVGR